MYVAVKNASFQIKILAKMVQVYIFKFCLLLKQLIGQTLKFHKLTHLRVHSTFQETQSKLVFYSQV